MASTIAILYPGAMGAALATVLHARNPSLRLLTSIAGRSASTLARAEAAGLENVSLATVVAESDIIFSILPPSAAVELATSVAALLAAHPRSSSSSGSASAPAAPVFVDANAVSPETLGRIGDILGETPLVDASIIGLPPRLADGYEPTLYLAADARWAAQLKYVGDALGGDRGLSKVKILADAGAGGASALKMCYGGLAKGTNGLAAITVLAANAHSPATAKAFMEELASSRADVLNSLSFTLNDMPSKAYRWVGEMEEISSFISSSLNSTDAGLTHLGLAAVFERLAADLRATGAAVGAAADGPVGDATEVDALKWFADESKEVLKAKGYEGKTAYGGKK
ncbi:uncharacterized protein EHS24_007395 [Apiotrichum porosum]|uniref:Phosphogluconate dehydrogenase NAD-binding putative C-terminal domain-containing protein n=1 Tax=Apiotrichum porosum TaxID=105984 RepID=A0A427XTZ9_9TREE|nr:uncharacterized protein EHS24_007395 [Apiotrichum porosum]RSH82426.1 hypothetical protein EHS24_007395 [Apiotrichum porosum]